MKLVLIISRGTREGETKTIAGQSRFSREEMEKHPWS